MTKHLLKLALMAMALLSSVAASAYDFDDGDLRYTILSGTTNCKVEAVNKSAISGDLVIPATVINRGTTYNVTEIATEGFKDASNLTSITFQGNNLVTIGLRAFKDTQGVTGTVTIPASVKTILVDGFCRCFADQFVFADGSQLETLGAGAFWGCKITQTPNLPNTITTFEKEVFVQCKQLTTAELPSNLTEIPYRTFEDCEALSSFTIPSGVTKIGGSAFKGCKQLASISLPDGVTEMGDYVFYYCENLASVKYSLGMTTVPANTFDNCYAMANVTGIDNVTRIEKSGFGDCRGFTSFTIPAGVEYIGDYALCEMKGCEEFIFAGNKVKEIGYEAFHHDIKLKSFTMPSSVEKISTRVFINCTDLATVDFSNLNTQITKLPNETFSGCSSLTSFTIPSHITEIGNDAFYNCSSWTGQLTIPAGVTNIGQYAFYNCKSLTGKVTIPAGVTSIRQYTFYNTIGITEFAFAEGSQLTEIGRCAFAMNDYNNSQLERFIMPNTVTTLGDYALSGWRKLDWDNFHLSSGVTTIPGYCFVNGGFTKFDLTQTNVTTLKGDAFQNNLFTDFHLPANITLDGTGQFCQCQNLERFYFEDGTDITNINGYLLYNDQKLNYVYLPISTPPTKAYGAFPDEARVTLDVPAEAIAAYKANSTWQNFKYFNALGSGTMDLTLDDASRKDWYIYTYNGHRYLYNDQNAADLKEDNGITWSFSNTVEKQYSLLFNTGNRSNVNETDKLVMTLYKIDAEGSALVQTKTVKITNCSNSVYAFPNIFEQMLIDFDEPLEVGKYQVKLSRLGDDGKFVWDAQIVPTENLISIETAVNPVGAGKITTGTSKLIQASDVAAPVTLTTALTATSWLTESWITFDGWTVGDETVSTETSYTFTPTGNTKVVANFTPQRQTIPTPEGETFSTQRVIVSNPGVTKYYDGEGGNIGWIKKGNYLTYFVSNTKPAIYDFKFMTGTGSQGASANDGQLTATVDVFDAEGNLVNHEVQTIAKQEVLSWSNTVAYSVRLTNPLMPGDYSVRITFYHPTCGNDIDQTNFGAAGFELKAIVPEQIAVTETAKIKVEKTATLTATLSTSTGDAITEGHNTITWTSSNTEVATVDQTGTVTAVAPGKATITAKATGRTDIELTAACEVTVPQHVTDITVPGAQSIYVGEEVTLEATAAPENAEDKSLTWASSNAAVATVDQTGKVTAVAKGDAVITVTATDRNKVSKTVAVEVKQQVTGITLNKTTETINKNTTLQLSVTAYAPENATQKEVKWSSSNEGVATVSETGLVTAVAGGDATITATAKDGKGATATCNVTVDVPVESVALDKASQNVCINDVVELTATVTPSDADQTVTWTSSEPTVASVVDGTVTAKAVGTVIITATSNHDGTKTATFTLTVMDVTAAGDGANKLLFHNIVNDASLTENKIAWKSESDHSWVANSIVLKDAQSYENPHDVTVASLTYNRTFSNNKPQALYVPFAMNYTDWADVAKVSYINNIHQWDDDDDGNINRSAIEFITIKSGSTEPNVPYIITPLETGDISINLTNATLKASPATDGFVDCASTKTKYTLTGVYKEMDIYNTGLLALGGGNFITPEDASDKLKPFRMYLKIESRTPGTPMQMPRKITVIIDGKEVDEATAIDMLNAIGYDSDAQYNLSGTPVDNGYKGIIIKNGKKIYKK